VADSLGTCNTGPQSEVEDITLAAERTAVPGYPEAVMERRQLQQRYRLHLATVRVAIVRHTI
jgi:hypothetical protein